MDDHPAQLDRIAERLEALERRVEQLEHPKAATASPADAKVPLVAMLPEEPAPGGQAIGVFTVLGRGLLGVAGAYVLRAVAESGTVAMPVVAAVAIVYGFVWLIPAGRVRTGHWFAPAAYAATSAAILSPMLWEQTLHFRVLTAGMAASVLCAYALVGALPAWWRNFAALSWVTGVAPAAVALALMVASHRVLPFVAALVAMAALYEAMRLAGRDAGAWIAIALVADLALWVKIYIYGSPATVRPDYPAVSAATLIAPPVVFFALLAVGIAVRCMVRAIPIAGFEAVQATIAFLLAETAILRFGSQVLAIGFGVACLALAGAGLAAVLLLFRKQPGPRNERVFAAWSALLLLNGLWLAVPQSMAIVCLSLAALTAIAGRARVPRTMPELFGLIWLLAALAGSGALAGVAQALGGSLGAAPEWAALVVLSCAIAGLVLLRREAAVGFLGGAVRMVYALLGAGVASAAAVRAMVACMGASTLPHHLALFRTIALCAVSAAFAYAGARAQRAELTRTGFAVLALVALKLLAEDLRHGQLAYIAASLVLFAFCLIVVPRLGRIRPVSGSAAIQR